MILYIKILFFFFLLLLFLFFFFFRKLGDNGWDALPPVLCTTDGTPEHVASDPLGLQLTSLFTADASVHDSH